MPRMITCFALPLALVTASVAHSKPGPARTATEAALAKIKQLNDQLHAVIAVSSEALADANALDKEPTRRGPLRGVTVILKDNIAMRAPMAVPPALWRWLAPRCRATLSSWRVSPGRRGPPRQGQPLRMGQPPLDDLVERLGVIGGQARSAYALDRTPCGSSSGTGAAVAAEMAQVGVGTETDGSILCPSSMMARA